jgi:2-methylcitrate dehydratase PrpD
MVLMEAGSEAMKDIAQRVARRVDELAHWAARVRWTDIPAEAARRAVMVIADDLAAMVASRDEPEVARVHAQLLAKGSERTATLFRGGRSRTDPVSAAIGNAIAANWSELDEGYRKATCHAGLYAVPALLAEAEAGGWRVADVLRALVVAYEVVTRFARAWSFPSLTLHPHALFGAVGAAVAVGILQGLDGSSLRDALTAAASLVSVGPYNHAVEGALVRNVWAAVGAFSGMQSVCWAKAGIGGLARTPYDVYSRALGGQVEPERLVEGLGEEWAIRDGYHKLYSCCQYAHSAVEATLEIAALLSPEDRCERVTRVVVETHRLGLTLDNYDPRTSLAARFSMPHIVATVLALGSAGRLWIAQSPAPGNRAAAEQSGASTVHPGASLA